MNSVQSIERALTLMEEAARQPGGLVDLARRADLPVSTTARILGTLEGAEAVTRSPDGSYRIGSLMRSMGKSLDLGTDLLTDLRTPPVCDGSRPGRGSLYLYRGWP